MFRKHIAASVTGFAAALVLMVSVVFPGLSVQAMSAATQQEISRNNHAIINSLIDSYEFDLSTYLQYYNAEQGYAPKTESILDGQDQYAYAFVYDGSTVNYYDQNGTLQYVYTYDSDHYAIDKVSCNSSDPGHLTLNKKNGKVVSIAEQYEGYDMSVTLSYDKYGRISDYSVDNGFAVYNEHFTYKNNRIVKTSYVFGDDESGTTVITRDASGRVSAAHSEGTRGTRDLSAAYNADGSLAQINQTAVIYSTMFHNYSDPISSSYVFTY